MQTVILCGGKATRLYPITKKIPKSMIEIEGKPFLEHQLELLKKNGILDIVLCIGDKGEQIENYFENGEKLGMKIKYSSDGNKLRGTGGALKKADKLLDNAFLVMYGDSYLPFDFQKAINFFNKSNNLGLMTIYRNNDKYELSNVEVEQNLVRYYSKTKKTPKMNYIDYGMSIFMKSALKIIPKDKASDLSELHKILIKEKELLAYPAEKRFYQIGSYEGLEEFRKYIAISLN